MGSTSPSIGSSASPDSSQATAALQFKNVFSPEASIWSLRFSKTNRGCLGALSSNGHFKTFGIAKDHLSEEYRSSIDDTLGEGSFKNYPEPVYTKFVRDVCAPFDHLSRGYDEKERVVSFDFLNLSISPQPSAIALDGNGQAQIITLRPPCAPVDLSSQGVLACGVASEDSDIRSIQPLSEHISPISELVENIRSRISPNSRELGASLGNRSSASRVLGADPVSSRESRELSMSLGTLGTFLTAKEALTLSTLGRFRCKEGYLFDESRNRKILADDPALQDFWDWVERKSCLMEILGCRSNTLLGARLDSSGTSMVVNGLDLNYLGVSNVWNNDIGLSAILVL